jgi:hypothetical protein
MLLMDVEVFGSNQDPPIEGAVRSNLGEACADLRFVPSVEVSCRRWKKFELKPDRATRAIEVFGMLRVADGVQTVEVPRPIIGTAKTGAQALCFSHQEKTQ